MLLGLSGTAAANGCLNLPGVTVFSGSIGSTTSCADYNNMSGCTVGAGGTGCNYPGSDCNLQVTVYPPVGQSGDKSTTFSVSGTCQAKMAITQGNQGANYCQYIYPTGVTYDSLTTLSNKGVPVSHKQLEICTDQLVASEAPPVLRLEKKIVNVLRDTAGDIIPYNCKDDATDVLDVILPAEVVFCYTIGNDGQATIGNLLLEDPLVDLSLDLGMLPGSGSGADDIEEDSGVVRLAPTTVPSSCPGPDPTVPCIQIPGTEELVNTATASGTFQGEDCDTCQDIDTASVNIVVECDPTTQTQANIAGAVVETRGVEGTSRCAPEFIDDTSVVRSVSLLCESSCDLRTECKEDPSSCAQPCEKSGNWTFVDNNNPTACTPRAPSPGKLPLCQEVLTNPSNDADLCEIKNPSPLRGDGHSFAYGRNPLLYYFPASGGGNSVGTIYCILLPGESPSVCPPGSFIY